MSHQPQSFRARVALFTAVTGALTLSSTVAQAAVWVGGAVGEERVWMETTNWSPAAIPINGGSTVAQFDAPFVHQPQVSSNLNGPGGIWVTGDTVGNVEISRDPAASATLAMQTTGTTINGNIATGVLIDNTSAGTLTISLPRYKIAGVQSWVNNSANTFTVDAQVDVAAALTIKGTGTTLITGPITNTFGLTKDGAGTLLVTGTSASSNGAITVSGGTLGGTGTVGHATAVAAAGTLDPGVSDATAGQLTFLRNLTLEGVTAIDLISPASFDTVFLNSPTTARVLTLGGTLDVDAAPGFVFAAGQVFDLFNWTGNTTITGTFASFSLPTLTEGLAWQQFGGQPFDYTNGQISVVAVAVPEPLTFGTIGLATAGLLATRRSSRRRA